MARVDGVTTAVDRVDENKSLAAPNALRGLQNALSFSGVHVDVEGVSPAHSTAQRFDGVVAWKEARPRGRVHRGKHLVDGLSEFGADPDREIELQRFVVTLDRLDLLMAGAGFPREFALCQPARLPVRSHQVVWHSAQHFSR